MLSLENVVPMPLLNFEGGFEFTPWETSAQLSPSPPLLYVAQAHDPAQAQVQAQYQSPTGSGSDRPGGDEDRRIRRMISNRESARRSRMRKQRHLEDLQNLVDRLRSENRELANRLDAVTRRCLLFCSDNNRLRSHAVVLRRRLADMQRIFSFRRLQRRVSPPARGDGSDGRVYAGEPQARTVPVYGGGLTAGTGQTLLA